MDEKLKILINESNKILITTHISPDPDAVSSVLLAGTTLASNFPDKQISMSVEELTGGLDFLSGYDEILISPLRDVIESLNPTLIIIVDAMSYARCSRGDAASIVELIANKDIKLAIIDHHESEGRDEAEVYINQNSPAAVQDVYEILFNKLSLVKPDGYAQTTMLGLYSDTGGFTYDNPRYLDTLKLVGDLIGEGVSIEKIKNQLNHYSHLSMTALGEIASNLKIHNGYVYSYLSDEFMNDWEDTNKKFEDIHLAVGVFANYFLRNIEENTWGFIAYRDIRAGKGCYGVSFRAIAGQKDVSIIANKLGGGGHKPAAGAKFKANSIDDAIATIVTAIEGSSSS